MEETRIICSGCGREFVPEDIRYFNDEAYCEECLRRVTTTCFECGERIYRYDSVGGDSSRPLCERCYDDYYDNCELCGRLILQEDRYYDDDDRVICSRCAEGASIHSYSYKPEPIFYGEDADLFMGVELEIDNAGEDRYNAKRLISIANDGDEYIYIKHDSSLSNGMEIVSHPMSLKFHCEAMPWKALMDEAISMGYCSHKASTCGLHCHVNRTFFGDTYEEQDKNIAKVLFLVEKYWDELLRFSRRTQRQMDRWAARYGFKERPEQITEKAKKPGLSRYTCINLANEDTIEFRMWRGTLKYNTFIATLQMVEKLCRVAISFSEEELQDLSWLRFVEMITDEELITYLKERRLYFDEEVITGEEE